MGVASGNERLIVFDTTLRDGEQSPGCSMTAAEKLRVALALAELGVDVIEAGFPASSPGDLDAVAEIARRVRRPVICALARCQRGDIDAAVRALAPAARLRLHVFIATSPIHRRDKLRLSQEEVLDRAVAAVEYARRYSDDVEFSAEDATRTEPEFLARVFAAAIAGGATTINVPDTVGYAIPSEFARLIGGLRAAVPRLDQVVLSVHCHDDLGLAVANSLVALEGGARQVECTINGIGERAGNCALEEIVMAVRTRGQAIGLATSIEATRLYNTSRLVADVTGSELPRNKAVVGDNAFSHEAGIHQHGMLVNPQTYEIMRPAEVGFPASRLVLGKHSGRHAFRRRLEELGLDCDEARLDEAFAAFKALADRRKSVLDADLEQLVSGAAQPVWRLEELQLSAHAGRAASAVLLLAHHDGRRIREAAVSERPMTAIVRAFERATGIALEPRYCRVRRMPFDEASRTELIVAAVHDGREHASAAAGEDFIAAAGQAILDIINRIERLGPARAREAPALASA